jgi:YD repeat-containing protein
MAKPLLPDDPWELIAPLLPPPKPRRRDHPGRKPVSDRQTLTGILFVLKTGLPSRTEDARGAISSYQYDANGNLVGYTDAAGDSWKQQAGTDSPQYLSELLDLSRSLQQRRQHAEAEPLLRECLAIRQRKEPDAWTTFETQALLGGTLRAQKKYAEAEPLLLAGYEGLKQREATIPANSKFRLTETLKRLVLLYDNWGQTDKAEAWRRKLEGTKDAAQPTTDEP